MCSSDWRCIYKQGELEYIRSVFSQSRPYYQDERLIVWLVKELPGATSACGAKAVLPGRLGGWNEREVNNQDEVQRWMDGNAEVNFFNSSKQPVNLLIETEVQSWQQPRQLQVWQAGKLMQEQTIGLKRDRLNLKLILPPGPNRVQFKTVEPGVKVEKQTRALLFYSFKLNDASPPACP